ncbi:MAG TPA: hypothetical protein VGI03_02435 [Verrucomicrobiae bacterium]|jgi:hypothetical protein
MKLSAILIFVWLAILRAPAQVVTLDISLNQDQYLPAETLPVTIHLNNSSGQTLHLGADDYWLTFSVQRLDNNSSVVKQSQPPVAGAFDLGSSEVATKHVDIAPYFDLKQTGRYQVIAFVHIPAWNMDVSSGPKEFDIVDGAELWSQVFGVPIPAGVSNRPPEIRKYTLEEANYLKKQLRMYVLVTDETGGHIYKVSAVGPMVSFGRPEAQLDSDSNLHVLYQSGAISFIYSIINPDGTILKQDEYDYGDTRPQLSMDSSGNIIVVGGNHQVKPAVLPVILPPNPLPAPAQQ